MMETLGSFSEKGTRVPDSTDVQVWGNSVGSLGPSAPWQIKNTFLHVTSASNEDFSNIRKVKSANDMAMRCARRRKTAKRFGEPQHSALTSFTFPTEPSLCMSHALNNSTTTTTT